MLHLAVLGLFLTVELCVVGLVVASPELSLDFFAWRERTSPSHLRVDLGLRGEGVVAELVVLATDDLLDVAEHVLPCGLAARTMGVGPSAAAVLGEGVRTEHFS